MNGKGIALGGMWVGGAILPLGLILFDLIGLHGVHLRDHTGLVGRDFANLYAGGRMVLEGKAAAIYSVDSYEIWLRSHFAILDPHNYSYPPFSLFLGVPLALLPYPVALIVWSAIGAALFMVAARPWLPRGFPVWLASLTPAALLNFYTGQYGLLVGALWLMTFDKLGRRDGQAGITAGLLTIKPHLGVILGLVLLRRPRAILAACAVCAVLIGLSELAFPGLWRDYFVNVPTAQAHILMASTKDFFFKMMPSAFASVRDSPYATVIHAAVALTAILIAAPIYRAPLRELCFPAATLTFLVLPYAFTYDMTVACLGFAILLVRRWNSLSAARKLILALAFASPQIVMIRLPVAPLLLAALWVQVRDLSSSPTQVRVTKDQDPPNSGESLMVLQ